MQKTELLHLHSLFRHLKRHFEREGVIDESLERYESLDVRPSHAHKSKGRHRVAVITLASSIADEIAKNSKYAADGDHADADGAADAAEAVAVNGDESCQF